MGPQLRQALRRKVKVVPCATAFFSHETDGFEQLQMLRDSGTCDRQVSRQLTDRARTLAQLVKDRLTRRMGQGP